MRDNLVLSQKNTMYQIRSNQGGYVIDTLPTVEKAINQVEEYIADDKMEGVYSEDFYVVYDVDMGEIIYIA